MSADRVERAYRAIHSRLWRSLVAYTGDVEVAGDAEAEAFAQALRRGDAIDDAEAWVWRSAFRIAAGMLDGERHRSLAPSATQGCGELPPSVIEFIDLLGGLSRQQRACVVLRYLGDYRPVEIAELLGTTAGTVRVQLHRAHDHLRTTLEVIE